MRRFVQVALLLSATTLFAQQPSYTWMRHYKSAPDVRMLREPLDKLLAEKKITGYGVLAPFTHIGDPWTHIVYVSTTDWASMDVRPASMADVHDVILRHAIQADAPSPVKAKYVVINRHPVSRGRDADAFALFNEWAKPVFVELAAKNRIGNWAQLVQTVVLAFERRLREMSEDDYRGQIMRVVHAAP